MTINTNNVLISYNYKLPLVIKFYISSRESRLKLISFFSPIIILIKFTNLAWKDSQIHVQYFNMTKIVFEEGHWILIIKEILRKKMTWMQTLMKTRVKTGCSGRVINKLWHYSVWYFPHDFQPWCSPVCELFCYILTSTTLPNRSIAASYCLFL